MDGVNSSFDPLKKITTFSVKKKIDISGQMEYLPVNQ